MFQRYADDIERKLVLRQYEVEKVFANLNPNLIQFYKSRNKTLSEETKMYHRSLRLSTEFECTGNFETDS